MFKNKKQLIARFLKENNLYRRFDINNVSNVDFIDKSFNWHSTKEGHKYWLDIQCKFMVFLCENDKDNIFENKKSYFHSLITSGYFNERKGCEKGGDMHKHYASLYEKYYS